MPANDVDISVRLGLLYQDGSTRSYNFAGVSAAVLSGITDRIKAINGAPSSNFFSTFVSESGSPVLRIATGTITTQEETVLYEG